MWTSNSDGGDSNGGKLVKWLMGYLESNVGDVEKWVREVRVREPDLAPEDLAQRAIRQAAFWAGATGAAAGLGEMLGPVGMGSACTAELVATARICVEMAQRVYAAFGYDISSDETKLRILAVLGGVTGASGCAVRTGTTKMGRRLAEQYLRGAVLKAVKAFFRRLGIVFTRKALVAWMPVAGSAVNYGVNRALTLRMGKELLASV